MVADLGLPVDAQLKDVHIATRYVCSLTLSQLEMLFARVAEPWDSQVGDGSDDSKKLHSIFWYLWIVLDIFGQWNLYEIYAIYTS